MLTQELELRKQKEIEFHNKLRDASLRGDQEKFQELTSNRKYYAVARASRNYFEHWLTEHCQGKQVLDYGCGDAPFSFLVASHGARVTGIDISDVSVENCKKIAREKGLEANTNFRVMDCEKLEFPDNYFDIVFVAGVLHHLDLENAFRELSRVVKPDGYVIAYEALAHNPLIHLYRLLTPHLRTEYETHHILKIDSLKKAKKYFNEVEASFFHLLVLLAVPFRNLPGFNVLLRFLETMDYFLLKIPFINRQAWMMVFILSNPKK